MQNNDKVLIIILLIVVLTIGLGIYFSKKKETAIADATLKEPSNYAEWLKENPPDCSIVEVPIIKDVNVFSLFSYQTQTGTELKQVCK